MTVRSIAVVRALYLGDLLCAVPALRSLRRHNEEARITLVGLPWAHEFAARFSAYIDDFIEFPGWTGIPERGRDLGRQRRFEEEAVRRDFDLAIQMHGDGSRVNEFLDLIPARRRSGFVPAGAHRDGFLSYPRLGSEVTRLLRLAHSVGTEDLDTGLEFPLTHAEQMDAASVLRAHAAGLQAPYVCVHAGGRGVERRWPPERFAAVAGYLQRAGLRVLLTGTEVDRAVNAAVRAAMVTAQAADLTGVTSTGTLAALIQGAALVVTNDTGPSHLAAALRVPSVVLFTGSDRERWAPADAMLHRAIGRGRPDGSTAPPDCPRIEEVLAAVDGLLAGASGTRGAAA